MDIDHWSHSKLSTYERCPALFHFRYIDKAPEERTSIALLLGSAVHGALTLLHARRVQRQPIDRDEMLASFEQQLRHDAGHSPVHFPSKAPELKDHLALGKSMLKVYLAEHAPQPIVALEQELTAPLPATAPLLGYIDRIEKGNNGTVTIVETKTSARAYSQSDADYADQVTAYGILLKHAGYHDVRYQLEILTKTKQPKLQVLKTGRNDKDSDRLIEKVRHVDRAIQAGSFPRHQSGRNCPTCPYRDRCKRS